MSEKKYIISRNPYTQEELGRFQLNTKEEVFEIIRKAKKAQKNWVRVPIREKIKKIKKIIAYIVANVDIISEEISKENGKVKIDALATEVLPVTMAIDYYCKNAKKFLKDEKIKSGNILLFNKKSRILKVPYGVIGIISPWNYPFSIPFSEIIKALLAGNSVVLKTASNSLLVGERIKKCINAADLPEGVFNYIVVRGSDAGDYLIDGGVNKIFFTGSVKVGQYLMEKASKRLLPLSLELGGNDPMIVLNDANIERAAWGAIWAGFQNSGQSCGGIERIYVQERIYDKFLNELKSRLKKLKIGPDIDFNSDIGGMTTKQQLETVKEHVDDALKKGAKIYYQKEIVSLNLKNKKTKENNSEYNQRNQYNNIFPPTILINVNHDMKLMKDETFGPVVGVMKFKTIEEAVEFANDSYLGLTASIWTRNKKLAFRIAHQIEAGVITINDHLMSHGLAETPWGGFKMSGIGKTHGKMGFEEMVQHKVVVNDILSFAKKDLWWHPFNKKMYEGLKSAMFALYEKRLFRKIKAWINVGKIFFRVFRN